MGIRTFIENVIHTLKLEHFKHSSKKKSIKNLLKKLKNRRLGIYKELQEEPSEKRYDELQEELDIISLQIQKGKKILNNLEDDNEKDE
jgi:hypothetical protein